MQTATKEQSKIEVAEEVLLAAKKRLAATEEVLFGPRRRYEKAMKDVLDAQAALRDLTETRYQGGVKK